MITAGKDFKFIYDTYVTMIYRICFSYLKNAFDTEDAVQNTFIKLLNNNIQFNDEIHQKAWLIVTASNICKDYLRKKHHSDVSFEDVSSSTTFHIDDTLSIVMQLPDKYKIVIYLYYYEGYSTKEIASMLQKPDSTIRNYLSEARKLLKKIIE